MKKNLYILPIACLLLTAACSTESYDDSCSQHARLDLQTRVVTFTETTGAATRADGAWQWADGAVLYMQYHNGTQRVSGHAVYDSSDGHWEGYFNGQLAASGRCELYYFDGASTGGLQSVSLTDANAVYADTTAAYSVSQGTIRVQAALRPLTARLRMKGSSGLQATVRGLARYTAYDAQTNQLTATTAALTATVGSDGYTPYVYATFADADTRQLSLTNSEDGPDLTFTRSFGADVLAAGSCGYVTIPTSKSNKGWREVELSASPKQLTFAATGTAVQTVSVTANGAWTATTDATWLTLTDSSGTGDGSFTVKAADYTGTTTDRTATITVSCGEATPVTVSVTQTKKDAVSVSPTTLTFAWDATTAQSVTVTANGAWTATTTATWLTLTNATGTGNGMLQVQPKSNNTSTTDRTATITLKCGTATATVSVKQGKYVDSTVSGYENGHAYVDLGLSVRWATMNVGASLPGDYGDYYAWGETKTWGETITWGSTSTKSAYNWSTYKYCNGSNTTLTKYNTSTGYGTVDNKTTLESEDDVAHVKWGGNWRMPTYDELSELNNTSNCEWTWYASGNTEFGGVAGYKVQSKKTGYTDRYIFLPAAGYRSDASLFYAGSYGLYWSSSLDTSYPPYARSLDFYSSGRSMNYYDRYVGRSVRPVTEP